MTKATNDALNCFDAMPGCLLYIHDKFLLIKGNFGVNLWQGNNPYIAESRRTGIYPERYLTDAEKVAYLSSLNEAEYDSVLQKEAIDFIVKNPGTFVAYTLKRIGFFWVIGFQEGINQPDGQTIMVASSAIFWVLRILVVLGIILSWKRWREMALLLLLFVAFPVPYYLTHVDSYRFRFPIEALTLVFAAYSTSYLLCLGKLGIDGAVSKLTSAGPKADV